MIHTKKINHKNWCPWAGSNCRPLPYQGSALPLSHMGSALTSHCVDTAHELPKAGAGEGNRTLVISLEGFSSTIELHPQYYCLITSTHTSLIPLLLSYNKFIWWRELDSNQRRRKPTDLQSAPFSRSGISPRTVHFLLFGQCCQSASPSSTSENAQTVGVWASHIGARQLPTFTRVIRTIIGVESFHGPVRDGKGWFQLAMVTGRRG